MVDVLFARPLISPSRNLAPLLHHANTVTVLVASFTTIISTAEFPSKGLFAWEAQPDRKPV